MLLYCVLTLLGVQGALSQIIRLGSCQRYTGEKNFDLSFIQTLTDHSDGFFIGVTSGPLNRRCQKIRFGDNGTYFYSYFDSNSAKQEYSGAYTAEPTTFTNMGTIRLDGLGLGQLGASLRGVVTLQVLMAERTRLLVSSCIPFGLANTAQVHGLIPTKYYTSTSGLEMIHKLKVGEFPGIETLQMTPQQCNNPGDDADSESEVRQARPSPTIKLVVSQDGSKASTNLGVDVLDNVIDAIYSDDSGAMYDTNARSSVNSIDLGITADPEEPNQVILETVGSFPVPTEFTGEIQAPRVEDLIQLDLLEKTLTAQDDETNAEKGFKIVEQRRQNIGVQTPNSPFSRLQALIPEGSKLNNALLDPETRMLLSNFMLAQSDDSRED